MVSYQLSSLSSAVVNLVASDWKECFDTKQRASMNILSLFVVDGRGGGCCWCCAAATLALSRRWIQGKGVFYLAELGSQRIMWAWGWEVKCRSLSFGLPSPTRLFWRLGRQFCTYASINSSIRTLTFTSYNIYNMQYGIYSFYVVYFFLWAVWWVWRST